jgi:membrane-bound inhibitor of C-type lysozyme
MVLIANKCRAQPTEAHITVLQCTTAEHSQLRHTSQYCNAQPITVEYLKRQQLKITAFSHYTQRALFHYTMQPILPAFIVL